MLLRSFLSCLFSFWVIEESWITFTAAAAAEENAVTVAIAKSRRHLAQHAATSANDAPFCFPKTRYRLALMLEAQLQQQQQQQQQDNDNTAAILLECAELYETAARNETSSALTPTERMASLYRAATILLEYQQSPAAASDDDDNDNKPQTLLWVALQIQPNNNNNNSSDDDDLSPLYAMVFEALAKILFPQGQQSLTNDLTYLQDILELCNYCKTLCPDEPVVDEFRGAALRLLYGTQQLHKTSSAAATTSSILAKSDKQQAAARQVYHAYEAAAHKSHRSVVKALVEADRNMDSSSSSSSSSSPHSTNNNRTLATTRIIKPTATMTMITVSWHNW